MQIFREVYLFVFAGFNRRLFVRLKIHDEVKCAVISHPFFKRMYSSSPGPVERVVSSFLNRDVRVPSSVQRKAPVLGAMKAKGQRAPWWVWYLAANLSASTLSSWAIRGNRS